MKILCAQTLCNIQVAFIGVINTLNPAVETPEQVADQLVLASKYIPVDQLGATDDCGTKNSHPISFQPPICLGTVN